MVHTTVIVTQDVKHWLERESWRWQFSPVYKHQVEVQSLWDQISAVTDHRYLEFSKQ